MKKFALSCVIFLLSWVVMFSQPRAIRKLPPPINQSFNCYAPFISSDGNTLVFLNDYTNDGSLVLHYSKRMGADWQAPVVQPKTLSSAINYIKGYTLSPDGQTLYITSQRSNGIGGFDILACTLKGSIFSDPVNIGLPVNSKLHEGSPTFSADGQTMYFMRCESMNNQRADRCKIMITQKQPGGRWAEPQELSPIINTGNSQTPRIMADGETLLFASDRLRPNKGGLDLFESKRVGTTWSNPISLDFVNTTADDQFVSVTSQSQYLLRDIKGERRVELVEYLFPPQLKPKAIMRVDGRLHDPSIPAYISAINTNTGEHIYKGRPMADGTFTVYLQEGGIYEVAAEPENASITFASRVFDLTSSTFRSFEKFDVYLSSVLSETELCLNAVSFKPFGNTLTDNSKNDLRRLNRLLKNNPNIKAEIQVMLHGYEEDSVQANLDLSEIVTDSLWITSSEDTTVVLKTYYHNDRTKSQANTIINELIQSGCEPNRLSYFVNAIAETVPENRKTVVRAVLRR